MIRNSYFRDLNKLATINRCLNGSSSVTFSQTKFSNSVQILSRSASDSPQQQSQQQQSQQQSQQQQPAGAVSRLQELLKAHIDETFAYDKQAVKQTRLESSDVTKIKEEHTNYVYTLDESESKAIFPEGFPGARPYRPVTDEKGKPLFPQDVESVFFWHRNKLYCDRRILVRKSTLSIIDKIKRLQDGTDSLAESRGFLLDGEVGVGKSLCLAHIIHYCRANNWLVISLPFARDWMTSTFQWFRVKGQVGYYDQRDTATEFLQEIKKIHEDKLSKIPIRLKETVNLILEEVEGTEVEKPTNLMHLIEFGLGDSTQSVPTALALREELNHVTEYPVLIAIDEYNSLFDETNYFDKFGRLFPEQMRLIARWRKFDGKDMVNGTMIAAMSYTRPSRNKFVITPELKKSVCRIPTFSFEEMKVFLLQLTASHQLMKKVDDKLVNWTIAMSGGRAKIAEDITTFNP